MKKVYFIFLLLVLFVLLVLFNFLKPSPFSEDVCKELLKQNDPNLDFEKISFTPKSNLTTPYGTAKEIKTGLVKNGMRKIIDFIYFSNGFLGCSLKEFPVVSYYVEPEAKPYNCPKIEGEAYFYYEKRNDYIYTNYLLIDTSTKYASLNIWYINAKLVNLDDVRYIKVKSLKGIEFKAFFLKKRN